MRDACLVGIVSLTADTEGLNMDSELTAEAAAEMDRAVVEEVACPR